MSNIYQGLFRVFYVQVKGEEEWAAREEARRIEVEGLKAELEAVKRAAESGGIDGEFKLVITWNILLDQKVLRICIMRQVCVTHMSDMASKWKRTSLRCYVPPVQALKPVGVNIS